MRILFEEYPYTGKDKDDVKDIIGDFVLTAPQKDRKTLLIKSVGYFYNNKIKNKKGEDGDFVIILPKVLLDAKGDKLTGSALGIPIQNFLDFRWEEWKDKEDVVKDGLTKKKVYDFVFGFSIWFYRAVELYWKNWKKRNSANQDDELDKVEVDVLTSIKAVGNSGRKVEYTFMDIVLALLDFQRMNRNFITFVMKMSHSGMNKISWPRTIAKSQAFIQDDIPVYLDLFNKKRVINFDEELIIIYYSILNYLHEEYGFSIGEIPGYRLIKGERFKSYINGRGKSRLRKIRYKYFSDKAVALWNLCFMFFDKAGEIRGNSNKEDYLLVNKFETVFEAMIDELIGDKELPQGLKVQDDNKRIDHLYTYKHLIENLDGADDKEARLNMYNIADSKYYRRDKNLDGGASVPKQFTYARNVIQWHMDLLHDLYDKSDKDRTRDIYWNIPLFDRYTESFNIIPNFFISALVNDGLSYDAENFGLSTMGESKQNEGTADEVEEKIEWKENKNFYQQFIFWERLFDRSTLFTLHYDVNFLFVLKKYAQNRNGEKEEWKREVRNKFRREMLIFLNEQFDFYQILTPDVRRFADTYFRQLRGKVFSFETKDSKEVLLYAERKNQSGGNGKAYIYNESDSHIENGNLVIGVSKEKVCVPAQVINLGASRYYDVEKQVLYPAAHYTISDNKLIVPKELKGQLNVNKYPERECFIVGYYKDNNQLSWIQHFGLYNRRAIYKGSDSIIMNKAELNANYLVLYNVKDGLTIYRIKSRLPYLKARTEFEKFDGYVPSSTEYYMVYDLDLGADIDAMFGEAVIGNSDIIKKISDGKPFKPFGYSINRVQSVANDMPNTPMPAEAIVYKFEPAETENVRLAAED